MKRRFSLICVILCAALFSLPAMAGCPQKLKLEFGQAQMNSEVYGSEYITHMRAAKKDAALLANRGVVILKIGEAKDKGTTVCKYKSTKGRYVVILSLARKYGRIKILKQYPDLSDQDLSVYRNDVLIEGQFYLKGRWKYYVKQPVFNYNYTYYYSCGFRVCTFRGDDTFALARYKYLKITP